MCIVKCVIYIQITYYRNQSGHPSESKLSHLLLLHTFQCLLFLQNSSGMHRQGPSYTQCGLALCSSGKRLKWVNGLEELYQNPPNFACWVINRTIKSRIWFSTGKQASSLQLGSFFITGRVRPDQNLLTGLI